MRTPASLRPCRAKLEPHLALDLVRFRPKLLDLAVIDLPVNDHLLVFLLQAFERLMALCALLLRVLLRTLELDLRIRKLLVHALLEGPGSVGTNDEGRGGGSTSRRISSSRRSLFFWSSWSRRSARAF